MGRRVLAHKTLGQVLILALVLREQELALTAEQVQAHRVQVPELGRAQVLEHPARVLAQEPEQVRAQVARDLEAVQVRKLRDGD